MERMRRGVVGLLGRVGFGGGDRVRRVGCWSGKSVGCS